MEYIPSYRDQIQNGSKHSWRDELYHHGIKGMKWGIRRPRNEDGILVGAGKQLAATMKARRRLKKDAKVEYKRSINKNKQRLQEWSKKANARYDSDEQYRKSGEIGREAEREVAILKSSNKAAKQKYKQTVNADKIAKAKAKASKYQRAAGRDSALRKHLRKQNLGVRVATSYLDLAAAGNQAYNKIQANRYNRRVNRLSN